MAKKYLLLSVAFLAALSMAASPSQGQPATAPNAASHDRYGPPMENWDMKALGSQWADPDRTAPAGMHYVLFPAPSAGAGIQGSVLVYLPPGYETKSKRYPVLYFLHGGMGNQRNVEWLLPSYIAAMKAGKMPETIIVSVQGLPIGWYVNANTGAKGVTAGPVENVIVKDLVPFIDAHYRTIAERGARGLEGWSMGGFGALRLAFKYNDLFAHASSISGALIDFADEPIKVFVENTFGPAGEKSSESFFDDVKPLTEATRNRDKIVGRTDVRIFVGDQDWLYNKDGKKITENFSRSLDKLGITHDYIVLPGLGHDVPQAIAAGQIGYQPDFWQKAFAPYSAY